MEVITPPMEAPALPIDVQVSREISRACCELSAFRLVMEAISSTDAEVSSTPAACSDAASARD